MKSWLISLSSMWFDCGKALLVRHYLRRSSVQRLYKCRMVYKQTARETAVLLNCNDLRLG